MSAIQNFYANQTIFLTGTTGFLGKLVLEKLLRTCYDLKKIYILVRSKKNKTQEERFNDIFEYKMFEQIKTLTPDFRRKVQLVAGDLMKPQLGLSELDISLLHKEVTCVIHVAADVRFDTPLKLAILTNVKAVRELLELVRGIRNLRSFVYVSTAYSNCIKTNVDEKFYDVDVSPETMITMVEDLDDKTLTAITPQILGEWPNTYVLSKHLGENLVKRHSKGLPVTVVRPAIVCCTAEEPLPGWIDNMHGLIGLVAGVSLGLVRSMNADVNKTAYIVPADYVVNNILAAAWDVDKLKPENQKKTSTSSEDIQIYNYVGAPSNKINFDFMFSTLNSYYWDYCPSTMVLYKNITVTTNKFVHKIRVFLLHTLLAYVVDGVLVVLGKPRMAVEKYRRLNNLIECISYFSLQTWNFTNKNVYTLWDKMSETDRSLFYFNMDKFDWVEYGKQASIGGRIYLLNDPMETLPKARRKIVIMGAVHYAFIALFLWLGYKLLLTLLGIFL